MGEGFLCWLWDDTLKVWVPAPAVVVTTLLDAEDEFIAGAHKLYWISCNPSAGNSEWGLSDAVAPGGDILIEHFHTTKESHNTNLIPPMQFNTGIFIEKLVAMTSMTFGYI